MWRESARIQLNISEIRIFFFRSLEIRFGFFFDIINMRNGIFQMWSVANRYILALIRIQSFQIEREHIIRFARRLLFWSKINCVKPLKFGGNRIGTEYEINSAHCRLPCIFRNILLCNPNVAENWYSQDWATHQCQGQSHDIKTDRRTGPFDVVRAGIWYIDLFCF